jgi:beta-barrel assembly-enhancing protease
MIRNRLKKCLSLLLITLLIQTGSLPAARAFTIGEERELGEKLLYQVRSAFPIIGDPDLHRYINDLGQEVLEVAGIQFFDYRFFIVQSKQFNAFAAPSGLIFFYTELIQSMESEDELVSVIAHEIGHVVKRHLASRMKKGTIVNIAALGAALAAIALGGGGAASQALLTGSLAAGQSAQLYFSREDEKEADLLAYHWLKELGRDTDGQRKMLQTMRKITRYRMGQIPQYLLTHPDPEARLDYVESLIAAEGAAAGSADQERDFSFLRFKYRIMALVEDNAAARAYFNNRLNDPRSPDLIRIMARYGLSQIDRRENNHERSLSLLNEVMAALPNQRILTVDQGIILAEQGEFEKAGELLETALLQQPTDMYAAFYLANVLEKTGDFDRAEHLLREVVDQMPEFSRAYFDLGRVLAQKGEKLAARFYLGKFNLYEGKLKLAEANFKEVAAASTAPTTLRQESEAMLELIERLKKG